MKKEYLAPELIAVKFETEDTLTSSIVVPGDENVPDVGIQIPIF